MVRDTMNNQRQIIYGLEKYFNFDNDNIKESFVKYLINIQHHIESDKPWALKELIAFDYDNLIDTNRIDRLNTYTSVCISQNLNIETTVFLLNSAFPEDKFCNILSMILSRGKENLLASIFSRTQILSKMWIGETISKFHNKFENVLLIGGWTSHHTLFFNNIKINNLVSVDIDNSINDESKLFNPALIIDNSNANDIFDSSGDIKINGIVQKFDLIINTSAEHMDLNWYEKLPNGSLVLIQSNNMSDSDHINKAIDLGDFLMKYSMSKTLYRGEFNFDSYSRFMLYGIK
jgi:hypothetical protein